MMNYIKTIISILFLNLGIISNASAVNSGYFYVFNQTDHKITIGVGNFFPTKYTISAHASTPVYVSTDNQNITIYSVS